MSSLSGEIIGGVHHLPVRVYFEDTDLSGIVYHANYLRFAERGRSDFLRAIGVNHSDLAASEAPVFWTLRKITVDYKKPARIDDLLDVRTVCERFSGAKLDMAQAIYRGDELLVRLSVEAACINGEGKPRRIPKDAFTALQALGEAQMGAALLGD